MVGSFLFAASAAATTAQYCIVNYYKLLRARMAPLHALANLLNIFWRMFPAWYWGRRVRAIFAKQVCVLCTFITT